MNESGLNMDTPINQYNIKVGAYVVGKGAALIGNDEQLIYPQGNIVKITRITPSGGDSGRWSVDAVLPNGTHVWLFDWELVRHANQQEIKQFLLMGIK